MNFAAIAWKSIRQRGLSSSLTSLSVALGVMLMVTVLVIFGILQNTFNQKSIDYDLIVGASGDPLQLVLSTVYHVSPPIENLPYKYLETLKKDPRVTVAIPITLGDRTQVGGFPIVGTVPEFFDHDYAPGRQFMVKAVRAFQHPFDAYIGARVAQENGWDVGTKLKLVHSGGEEHVHDEEFEVVGILGATGTPHDKTVYINVKGFYQISGHDKPMAEAIRAERAFFNQPELSKEELEQEVARLEKIHGKHDHGAEGHDHAHHHAHDLPDFQKEVTAILLECRSPIAAQLLAGEIKKAKKSQAVNPLQPMQTLMNDILGPVQLLLLILTILIILVSGIGIFVSIYNSMSARRKEIAILRALGAQRSKVLAIVMAESVILCLSGGLLGLLLGHGLVLASSKSVEIYTGLLVNPFYFSIYEIILFPCLLLLGVLVGFLPGMTAYQTDVADALNS